MGDNRLQATLHSLPSNDEEITGRSRGRDLDDIYM